MRKPLPESDRSKGMRGQLTEEIQAIAKAFLGREITTVELRLYAYLDYLMKMSSG